MQNTHKLVFSDSERIALEEAIEIYKKFIEDKIEAPYWARLRAIKRLEQKLNQN